MFHMCLIYELKYNLHYTVYSTYSFYPYNKNGFWKELFR